MMSDVVKPNKIVYAKSFLTECMLSHSNTISTKTYYLHTFTAGSLVFDTIQS